MGKCIIVMINSAIKDTAAVKPIFIHEGLKKSIVAKSLFPFFMLIMIAQEIMYQKRISTTTPKREIPDEGKSDQIVRGIPKGSVPVLNQEA